AVQRARLAVVGASGGRGAVRGALDRPLDQVGAGEDRLPVGRRGRVLGVGVGRAVLDDLRRGEDQVLELFIVELHLELVQAVARAVDGDRVRAAAGSLRLPLEGEGGRRIRRDVVDRRRGERTHAVIARDGAVLDQVLGRVPRAVEAGRRRGLAVDDAPELRQRDRLRAADRVRPHGGRTEGDLVPPVPPCVGEVPEDALDGELVVLAVAARQARVVLEVVPEGVGGVVVARVTGLGDAEGGRIHGDLQVRTEERRPALTPGELVALVLGQGRR